MLDTNVVLDWLLFRDPSCQLLGDAITAGRLWWIGSENMRSEFRHVLARAQFDTQRTDDGALHAHWERFCTVRAPAALSGAALRMRCTDHDDQMFIDLALSARAPWLLSRDRAVLKLANRARALGTQIVTPHRWLALQTPAGG